MKNREIYAMALSLMAEGGDKEALSDYEERAGYLLSAYCCEVMELEQNLKRAQSEKEDPVDPPTSEESIPEDLPDNAESLEPRNGEDAREDASEEDPDDSLNTDHPPEESPDTEEDVPLYLPLDCAFPYSAALAVPGAYYLAAMLILDEDPDLSDKFFSRYCDAVARICASLPAKTEAIIDRYGFV